MVFQGNQRDPPRSQGQGETLQIGALRCFRSTSARPAGSSGWNPSLICGPPDRLGMPAYGPSRLYHNLAQVRCWRKQTGACPRDRRLLRVEPTPPERLGEPYFVAVSLREKPIIASAIFSGCSGNIACPAPSISMSSTRSAISSFIMCPFSGGASTSCKP